VIDVRPCTERDLRRLESAWPVPGDVHASHFRAQERGDTTFLIAWSDSTVLGTGVVRWSDLLGYQLSGLLPGCPEICHLQVRPEYRGEGVGSRLIAAAEDLVRSRGITKVGVVVGVDNPRAAALYQRLGFVSTGQTIVGEYDWQDDEGRIHHEVETNAVLVKDLNT
jgi:ribosomal protein S18 acetylase RimI-like enzyme